MRESGPGSEQLIRAFEEAWRRGEAPAVGEFLRAAGVSDHALLVELVHVDLELRLKADLPVRVEAYLEQFPHLADDSAEVVELLAAECRLRRRRGEPVSFSEYATRFPGIREALAHRLDDTVVAPPYPRPLGRRPRPPLPSVPGYEVLGELGRGGMGVVFKARDTRLDRHVALKFLPAEYVHDPERLDRFLREARTASALNHPNICTVHNLGEHDGRPFLVLELIDGRTLRALAGEALAPEALARIAAQAAGALAAAHGAGVVHRDIKPDNVMVRGDGLVKVLDFGLARRLPSLGGPAGRDTAPGQFLGTAAYTSPEQARGEPATSASDVFSLGIVLYQLATGTHPFEADSPLGFLHAIAHRAQAPAGRLRPELGGPLSALLEAMLQKSPALRPTAGEVERALGAVAAGPSRLGPAKPAAAAPRRTVGRQAERAALRGAWAEAEAGRGAVLCVSGEPGIGKTTLVEDFLRELRDGGRPCLVARGRCAERLAGAEAYVPILEALEALLGGEDGAAVTRVMQAVAPTWYAHVAPPAGHATPPPPGALASSRQALTRELAGFLREAGRLAPVVLFLDDVHWADLSTTDLLAQLGRAAPASRFLALLTYRPTELLLEPHPFLRVKLELQAQGACRDLGLGLLPPGEVAAYLDLTFPDHDFPPDLAAAVHARTDGGPLFMADLLGYLRDRGAIAARDGRWSLTRPLSELCLDLPESAKALIHRKLDHLAEADRRLLAAAAVQGPAFDAAVVAGALGQDAAATEEQLQALGRVHGLVRQEREYELPDGTPTLRYRFVHVLYQQALYHELAPARRAALSLALAKALDFHQGGEGPAAAELAGLYEAGRDFARAAAHCSRAARNAAAVFAHQDAVGLARRGLGLIAALPATDERDALELQLRVVLGMQLQVTQGFAAPEAHQAYARARQLCDAAPPAGATRFRVLWGLWLFHKVRSDLARAAAMAEELRQLAAELADPGLGLQAQQALTVTALCRGDPAAVVRHMELAAGMYDPVRHRSHTMLYGQDPSVACQAFGAVALALMGQPDAAARLCEQAVRLGHGKPSTLALALLFAAMVYQIRREPARARERAEQCLAVASEHGLSFWHAGATVMRGWAMAAGGVEAGLECLAGGLRDWRATGSVTYLTYFLGLQAEALGWRGRAEEARRAVGEALALVARTGEGMYEAELHRLDGVLLGPGCASAAAERLAAARQVARAQGAVGLELRAAVSQARLDGSIEGLAELRGRICEGEETADVREADALLWRQAAPRA